MKTKFKVLIALAVIAVLGLIGFLIWWFKFRDKPYEHKRTEAYRLPVQEEVHKKIDEDAKISKYSHDSIIPKVVYMTYHDIDGIPSRVLENIRKNCEGYRIEIHGDQSCEDFLYAYYGPDAMQLFREIKIGAHKADFWRYCMLYAKGGYYFDIKTNFKKHIDEIFKINDKKMWSTVLCTKEFPRCIFNGIIVTAAKNPVLWNALNYFFDHPHPDNYLEYVYQLYELVQRTCEDALHVGINPQNNGWTCVLLKESCDMDCSKRGSGSCGHDGRDCQISNASGQEVIQTRYIDFPWPKSYSFGQTRMLLINPGGNVVREQRSTKMAVVTSFPYHFECLGVILDMTKDKYEIDFYGVHDPEGYIDYFHSKYDFKSFLLNRSNLDESRYDHIVKLTSNDPYKVEDLSKLVQIQHAGRYGGYSYPASTIRLSPLMLKNSNIRTLLSIFEGDNLPQRRDQIIMLGEWVDGPLQRLIQDFKYKIILVRRNPRKGDERWCHSRNIQCIYSPDTEELINLIKVSKFIYVHKANRFSGSIALALSFHVPMIMDVEQASVYDFPCFTYVDSVTELAPRLNKISIQEYTESLQELSKYTKEKRSFNRQNVDNIFTSKYPNYITNIYSPSHQVMIWSIPNNHFPNTIDHDREVKQDLFEYARRLPMEHCVVDGGAHIGDLTIPVAHALRSVGREDIVVYAIEPDHKKCLMIEKMAASNKLNNVRVLQVGISDREGFYEQDPVSMNDPERIKLNNTGGISWRPAISKGFPFTTIDKLVVENKIREPIGAIHLDVEGMEIECIKGSMQVIERSSPYLSIERSSPYLSIENLSNIYDYTVHLPSHYKFKNRINSNDVYAAPEGSSTEHLLPPCFTSDHVELGERIVDGMFTRPDACVLEIGGGSGAASTIIQRKLRDPRNHVVIQPDESNAMYGGLTTLTKNKQSCGSQYHIVDHILKAGEGQEIQMLVSKPFNTLVVDCEGCLVEEYEKNPVLFDHITMIQVERDDLPGMSRPADYESLFIKLGFKKIHSGKGCDGNCPTEVWTRRLEDGGLEDRMLRLGEQNEKRLTSQNGEDGIIAEIFQRIGVKNKYYVEFGAGHDYDNTIQLDKQGWSGLLMGGDGKDRTSNNRNIVKAWITHENIASLFAKYQVPVSFDFLSIDTDFKDYWILQSILKGGYRPRVICAEVNRNCYPFESLTIPKDIMQKQWNNGDDYFGATPQAFKSLVEQYGYDLVYCEKNAVNCFFVLNAPKGLVTKLDRVFSCRPIHKDSGTKPWYNTRAGGIVRTKRR